MLFNPFIRFASVDLALAEWVRMSPPRVNRVTIKSIRISIPISLESVSTSRWYAVALHGGIGYLCVGVCVERVSQNQ